MQEKRNVTSDKETIKQKKNEKQKLCQICKQEFNEDQKSLMKIKTTARSEITAIKQGNIGGIS